jgi:hypothetical protein
LMAVRRMFIVAGPPGGGTEAESTSFRRSNLRQFAIRAPAESRFGGSERQDCADCRRFSRLAERGARLE